ncbi:MAG: winged helix-turn-helix transcriptional regulator [Lachnospiraceae bacterium]|nr:winged helix-turn-helix transcriptional regulator [Lachnospiraceae bacterium]
MQENKERYQLYCDMINELDEGCRLITEYDALPHDYGSDTMYQAESQLIHIVGKNPGITASEIAELLKKTPSACSQLIRKLRKKEWMEQILNKDNNRQYQLYLTDAGWKIYKVHDAFEQCCYQRSFRNLDGFSDADFAVYIAIQKKLNETFALDVAESRKI